MFTLGVLVNIARLVWYSTITMFVFKWPPPSFEREKAQKAYYLKLTHVIIC